MVKLCLFCGIVTIMYLALIVALFELSVDDPVQWTDEIKTEGGYIEFYSE